MKEKISEAEQYKKDIFEYLDKLPEGVISLDKLCLPENREKFISIVKSYIDRGDVNGFCTEFNRDYTAIKRFDTMFKTPSDILKESLK